MRHFLSRARGLFADRRGSFLVEYSSFALLIAIAAIAVLGHVTIAPD